MIRETDKVQYYHQNPLEVYLNTGDISIMTLIITMKHKSVKYSVSPHLKEVTAIMWRYFTVMRIFKRDVLTHCDDFTLNNRDSLMGEQQEGGNLTLPALPIILAIHAPSDSWRLQQGSPVHCPKCCTEMSLSCLQAMVLSWHWSA